MTPAAGARVAAVVMVGRGGDDLRRALERAHWADERLILDSAGRVPPEDVPAGVACVVDPRALGDATASAWIALLHEGDELDPAAVAAVRSAVAGSARGDVFRLPVVTEALDFALAPARPAVWIAERHVPVRLESDFQPTLAPRGTAVRTLATPVRRRQGGDITAMLETLNGESNTLAATAARLGYPRRTRGVARRALVAGLRTLVARAHSGRLGLGRWVMAVFGGYRVLLAYAKLWELERDRVLERG